MTDSGSGTPRWGNEHRERKASAIFRTLETYCGRSVDALAWADFGCGSAGLASSLARRVRSIVGIDPEPWPNWAMETDANENLRLLVAECDAGEPPLPPGSKDVIVCNQVYEHVRDPRALVRNIALVLRPGGCCYFAGPNLLWPVEPHVHWPLVHWLPRRHAHTLMRWLGCDTPEHLDAYSATCWTLRSWFFEQGLVPEEGLRGRLAASMEGAGRPALAKFVSAIPRAVFAFLMPVSPGFVFVLRKPLPDNADG